MASAQRPAGLITLPCESLILREVLKERILGDKREPCEVNFSDFDDVAFRVKVDEESPNNITVNMSVNKSQDFLRNGAQEYFDRAYPGMVVAPDNNFDIAIRFDVSQIGGDKEAFLTSVCRMRRNFLGAPVDKALTALKSNSSSSQTVVQLEIRHGQNLYICPARDRVICIFALTMADETDRCIAGVFLSSFEQAQREVPSSPPTSYTREPSREISSLRLPARTPSFLGYLSFTFEARHVSSENMKESAVSQLSGFVPYLVYHIKSTKTYMHMRMRRRVETWLKVLARSVPEVEKEKKTIDGKTFKKAA